MLWICCCAAVALGWFGLEAAKATWNRESRSFMKSAQTETCEMKHVQKQEPARPGTKKKGLRIRR